MGVLSPQVRGVSNFNLIVFDPDVDRFFRLSLENDEVISGGFEFLAEKTSGIGRGNGPVQRAFGDDHVSPARRGRRSRQRTRSENQLILRAEGIRSRGKFVIENLRRDPPPTEKVPRQGLIEGLFRDLSRA